MIMTSLWLAQISAPLIDCQENQQWYRNSSQEKGNYKHNYNLFNILGQNYTMHVELEWFNIKCI